MRKALGCLVLALLLAGCLGGGGETAEATPVESEVPAADTATPAAGTATPDGDREVVPLDGDHPHVENGTVNASALVLGHLQRLSAVESYTLGNNGTFEYAANGTAIGTTTRVDHVDLADERLSRVTRRQAAGEVQRRTVQYGNATHQCTVRRGSLTCDERAFQPGRVIAMAIETTGLETVFGPAFEPDGTVTRDGQGLYRYRATTLRENLSESTVSELGSNATLSAATLLVHPSGRIVEYESTRTAGRGDARSQTTVVYTTRDVNATSVPDAATVVTE